MPELSRFFGIIIRMYMEAGVQHHAPHFHAYYGEVVAVYSINPVELIGGELPCRQQRMVEAWAELHQRVARRLAAIAGWTTATANRTFAMIKHAIYKVRSVEVVAPYTLRVGFDDATEQTIDFRPVLAGEFYRPLRELALLNQVKIDLEVHTLVWPNGADFDPALLHDWPENAAALAGRAREWESQPAHA